MFYYVLAHTVIISHAPGKLHEQSDIWEERFIDIYGDKVKSIIITPGRPGM